MVSWLESYFYTHTKFSYRYICVLNPKTLLLYLLFTKQTMNRHIYTVIEVLSFVYTKNNFFSSLCVLCFAAKQIEVHNQLPIFHWICRFLFECALWVHHRERYVHMHTHYFLVMLVWQSTLYDCGIFRVAPIADGSKYFYCYYTKCGKMENLLPTVLVQLVNHSNECKVINMHCIFAACMVICELFCYSIFLFQFFNSFVCFLSHSLMTKYSYCCFIFMWLE